MSRTAAARWPVTALLLVVLLAALAPAPAAAAPGETGKYYVVASPAGGRRDYLYDIALRTLRNGNRFREIIDLNRGRRQPDGATFTDGVDVAPGWILMLPGDAEGPGVRSGPLPPAGLPSPARTRPRPAATTPAPSGSAPVRRAAPGEAVTTRAPGGVAATRPAPGGVAATRAAPGGAATRADPGRPVTTRAAPTVGARPPARPGLGELQPYLLRGGAGLLAVVLAAFAVFVLRRGAHRRHAVVLEDGPWPPERHHTPTPAELDAMTAAQPHAWPALSDPAPDVSPRAPLAPGQEAPEPAVPAAADNSASMAADHSELTVPENSAPMATELSASIAPALPAPMAPKLPTPMASGLRAPIEPELPAPMAPSGVSPPLPFGIDSLPPPSGVDQPSPFGIAPPPPLPSEIGLPYVQADLDSEAGPIRVRLAGATEGPADTAYAWLTDDEPAPPAAVPLVLGRAGQWWLHVDLSRTPDVLTVLGDPDDCRRLTAAFARQWHADGIGVAVVGDALGSGRPDGCRELDGFPAPGDQPPGPSVVIAADLPASGMAAVRGLVAATGGRCVPVLIGRVPNSRWSVRIGADA